MADVTLTYKGNTILELNDSAIKSIKTAGKYLEDDIELDYIKSGGGEEPYPPLPNEYQELEYLTTNADNGHPYITVNAPQVGDIIQANFLGDGVILGSRVSSWNFNIAVSNKSYTPYRCSKLYVSWDIITQDVNTWSSFAVSLDYAVTFNYGRWDGSYLYNGDLGIMLIKRLVSADGTYNSIWYTNVAALIPCYRKVDGVNGFYDTVNNVFYTSPTGTFTRGPEITIDIRGSGIRFGSNRPPEASLGINGEYYYQRNKSIRSIKSFSDTLGGSNAIAYGVEFTVSQNTTVTHLCGRTTENRTGKLQIGTTSGILAEIENVSFPAGEWVEKELSSPIQLTTGVNYVVRAVVDSTFSTGKVAYARSAAYVTYSEIVTNVQGRYSSDSSVWPGTAESNSGCLVCFRYLSSDDLYRISSQFYKSSSVWSEIT